MDTPGQPHTVSAMTHRAYQPLLPTVNKYLQQKWDKSSYDLHRGKVKSAKSEINTSSPKTYGHLTLKLKTRQLQEEWTMKVERENNMLLEKISRIMRTTGAVDCRNFYKKNSLSKEKRQQELLRITKENQMIHLRLGKCRSFYNTRSWHDDWLKTVKVMNNIACYPRGGANEHKGQKSSIAIKKCRDCDKEEESSPASSEAHGKAKSEENVKGKETSKTEETGKEQDTTPEPNGPDKKSISPGTPENPASSDTITTENA